MFFNEEGSILKACSAAAVLEGSRSLHKKSCIEVLSFLICCEIVRGSLDRVVISEEFVSGKAEGRGCKKCVDSSNEDVLLNGVVFNTFVVIKPQG